MGFLHRVAIRVSLAVEGFGLVIDSVLVTEIQELQLGFMESSEFESLQGA